MVYKLKADELEEENERLKKEIWKLNQRIRELSR